MSAKELSLTSLLDRYPEDFHPIEPYEWLGRCPICSWDLGKWKDDPRPEETKNERGAKEKI